MTRLSRKAGLYYKPVTGPALYTVSLYDANEPDMTPLASLEAAEGATVYVDIAALLGYDWIIDDHNAVTLDNATLDNIPYTEISQSEVEFVMPASPVAVWVRRWY